MWKKSEPEEFQSQSASIPQIQPAPAPRNSALQSQCRERAVIGPTISIKGDLSGDKDLVIEGHVEGKVELPRHSITIGKNGSIRADIYVPSFATTLSNRSFIKSIPRT